MRESPGSEVVYEILEVVALAPRNPHDPLGVIRLRTDRGWYRFSAQKQTLLLLAGRCVELAHHLPPHDESDPGEPSEMN